jgi:hypothetical protein
MLTILLPLVPAVLILLHFLTNEGTKGKLKKIVQDSYFALDETADRQKLASLLVAYRWQLKSVRKWFIVFFSLATLGCFLSTFYQNLFMPREGLEKSLADIIRFDIDKHYELTFYIATSGPLGNVFYDVGPTSCTPRPGMFHFVDVKPDQAKRLIDAVHDFSDMQLRAVFLISEAIYVSYAYVVILLALLLSFMVTSALLSGFVQSRLMIFVTFGMTLVIAVIMPFLMIEAVTYLRSLVALNAVGTLPDFYSVAQPTVLHLAFALANFVAFVTMNLQSLILLIYQKFNLGLGWGGQAFVDLFYGVLIVPMLGLHIGAFWTQIARFNRFDFDIPEADGIRNWGVFTDVIYSISYLAVCYLLILSHRNVNIRDYCLQFLEDVDSDPKGPFMALAARLKMLMAGALSWRK